MDGYYDDGLGKDCKKCYIRFCRVCDNTGAICLECENKNLDPRNCITRIIS